MTRFRFFVTAWLHRKVLDDQKPVFTNMGSAIEARLHTATSSGEVYSMISVHKLEERMVPRFF